MNIEQQNLAKRLLKEGKSVSEVARTFSVHPATLYRILKQLAFDSRLSG
jgi:transposase-like protein